MKKVQKKVDKLDRQILNIITKDARVSFKDIASVCGVSRAAIHQRVTRMENSGVITGSSYSINPKFLGYSTCSYVGIRLDRGSRYRAVVEQITNIPEVVECHFTTGSYTMLIKLYAHDNEHLMELLNNQIQAIDGVISTETLISLDESIQKKLPIRIDEEEDEE